MTPTPRKPFKCRAVLTRAIAIDSADEDHVEQGDTLATTAGAFGRVVAIRQHRLREDWSVLELDREARAVRGQSVIAIRAGDA